MENDKHSLDENNKKLEELSKKFEVASGLYAKGNAIALSQSAKLENYQKNVDDKTNVEQHIADKLQDIIQSSTSENATIKDKKGANIDIKTLKKIAEKDGKVNKELLAMLDKVGEGVKMNASTTKSTGKFIKDQALDAGVTMVSALTDSPLLAALGSQLKSLYDFRKQKKQDARDQQNAIIQKDISDAVNEQADILESTNKSNEDISDAVVQIEKNTTKNDIDNSPEITKQDDNSPEITKQESGDIADLPDITSMEDHVANISDGINKLVDIQKDTLSNAERARLEANENAMESSRKKGKANRGKNALKDIDDGKNIFDFLKNNVLDLFQTFAIVSTTIGGILAKISALGFRGVIKVLGKALLKFVAVPMAIYDMITGFNAGWNEKDENASFSEKLTNAIQTAMGKMLSTFTMGLIDKDSLKSASKWVSDTGVLDGLFKFIDGYIDTYVSIFKYIAEKLTDVAEYFWFNITGDKEAQKRIDTENRHDQLDDMVDSHIVGGRTINRDFGKSNDITLEDIKYIRDNNDNLSDSAKSQLTSRANYIKRAHAELELAKRGESDNKQEDNSPIINNETIINNSSMMLSPVPPSTNDYKTPVRGRHYRTR